MLEYSNEEGSETASIIGRRIAGQILFSMAVGVTQLRVKSACTDCEMSRVLLEMPTTNAVSLSSAVGGGLFIGGFATAILIIMVLGIIVYVYQHLFGHFARQGAI